MPQIHGSVHWYLFFDNLPCREKAHDNKNSDVEIKNLVVNHKSQPVQSNLAYLNFAFNFFIGFTASTDTPKSLGGFTVDSAFHPSALNKMSTRNFWELSVKVYPKHLKWLFICELDMKK